MSEVRYAKFDRMNGCYFVRNRGEGYWYECPDGTWCTGDGEIIRSQRFVSVEIRTGDDRIIKAKGSAVSVVNSV